MSTKEALGKLNDTQKNTLEHWAYMRAVYEKVGREVWMVKYSSAFEGYLHALEELGMITETEKRLIRFYFVDKGREEAQNEGD